MSLRTILSSFILKSRQSVAQNQRLASLHTSAFLNKAEDRKEMLASMPAKDEGTAGEKSIDIDTLLGKYVLNEINKLYF